MHIYRRVTLAVVAVFSLLSMLAGTSEATASVATASASSAATAPASALSAGGLSAGGLSAGGLSAGGLSAAASNPGVRMAPVFKVTLCLYIRGAWCALVPGGRNVSGQRIFLRNAIAAHSSHWYQVGVSCPGQTPGAPQCFAFSDTNNTSLCLGSNAARNVVLMSCSAAEAAWVANADHRVRNASWGPLGDLAVAAAKQNSYLYTSASNDGLTQWSGYVNCAGC
jgi:hypothetical protein